MQLQRPSAENLGYWDVLAGDYDSLYASRWSLAEDQRTASILRKERPAAERISVLDLGCGTGLGLNLLGDQDAEGYVGIDLSEQMLSIFQAAKPNVTLLHGDALTRMSSLPASSFDYVISINSAASFIHPTARLLAEVGRVLGPNGRFCLSFLNRNSLRRTLRFRRESKEWYRSRNEQIGMQGVLAQTMSVSEFRVLSEASSLCIERIDFQSVLGGVLEADWAVRVEPILIGLVPKLAHSLIFSGSKNISGDAE